MKIKTSLFVLIFSLTAIMAAAQDKASAVESAQLASSNICGTPNMLEKIEMSGTVLKREFDDDEVTLAGILFKHTKDQRSMLNIDVEFLEKAGGTLPADLSAYLPTGKKVNATVFRCDKILYLAGVKPVK